jgi:hypothetical protein
MYEYLIRVHTSKRLTDMRKQKKKFPQNTVFLNISVLIRRALTAETHLAEGLSLKLR